MRLGRAPRRPGVARSRLTRLSAGGRVPVNVGLPSEAIPGVAVSAPTTSRALAAPSRAGFPTSCGLCGSYAVMRCYTPSASATPIRRPTSRGFWTNWPPIPSRIRSPCCFPPSTRTDRGSSPNSTNGMVPAPRARSRPRHRCLCTHPGRGQYPLTPETEGLLSKMNSS